MNKDEILKIFKESENKSQVIRKLGFNINGAGIKKVDDLIYKYKINVDHFNPSKKQRKYPLIEKKCPICGNVFQTKKGHKKEKTTCSRACSNSFFRSGNNHPNWKPDEDLKSRMAHRNICERYHEMKCVVCGEEIIVDVHHLDGNSNNNDPKNLLPICPTHHRYWHSDFRYLIADKVSEYLKNKWC